MERIIEIEDSITVGDLAEKLLIPVSQLITELMKNGVMATVNERIDIDTAQIIIDEMGIEAKLVKSESQVLLQAKREVSENAKARPPVVAVMGHVDHGKTTLLDSIRGSEVVKREAGGITQHISAYQIKHDNRLITFLDTPGHEAFAAMREHGAQLTDLVILVVAADDGVKPQTIEAIRFANKAGVKILVAINKIDKEGADVNKIKQQLADNNLLIEEWGGEIVVQEVSAKTKVGIKELLDMVLLLADVENLRADLDVPASGLIVEAHMEQGRGPVAVALVEAGILKPGDFIVAGSTYARIRNLESTDGKKIKEASPSTPVIITGFKGLPEFGDSFEFVKDEKEARNAIDKAKAASTSGAKSKVNSSELIRLMDRSKELTELNVIIKVDVQGSLTSVLSSLKSLDTKEVAIKVISSGVGDISENDVHIGKVSNAIVYGFNVNIPASVKQLIRRDKISVRLYKVIYELIDDAKEELSNLLVPEIVETVVGTLEVKGIFKTTKTENICGGQVVSGKLSAPLLARITRKSKDIGVAEIVNVKRGPQDAKEVVEGEMCGISLKTANKIELAIGDKVEGFTRETIARKL